jgi:hypothetical protein
MSIAIYRKSLDGKTASQDDGKKGVVEPNHLSAPRNGQVYAQYVAAAAIKELENGMFVKYDAVDGNLNMDNATDGPWYMVFNEEKLYDERKQSHRDYSMKATDFTDGKLVPRVFAVKPGDIYTTNTVADAAALAVGDKLYPNANGLLSATIPSGKSAFAEVVKEYTLPDGITPGVKIRIIAEAV